MGRAALTFVRFLALIAALTGFLVVSFPASAQDNAAPSAEIAVAVKPAPPFAFKLNDGTWTGLSIELWQKLAARAGIPYHLVEVASVKDQIEGVAAGKFDAATAAITVTAEREKIVDFTQPFYKTGLGIAVPLNGDASWRPIVRALTSFGFLQAIAALVVISLVVGLLIWLFERKQNEDFGGGVFKGIFSSIWWSTIAATQASTGELGPRTTAGRALAMLWMLGSIIAIAVFTASVTSAITVTQLQGLVQNEGDLQRVRVGIIGGSSAGGYLDATSIRHTDFATLQDGLDALRDGKLDAFVYDKPILDWTIGRGYGSALQVVDATFDEQDYGIALKQDSPLRQRLNVALLETLESDWWAQATFQYLGKK